MYICQIWEDNCEIFANRIVLATIEICNKVSRDGGHRETLGYMR